MLNTNIFRSGIIASSAIMSLLSLQPASAQSTIIIDRGGYTQTVPTTTRSSVIYYNSRPSIGFPKSTIARPNYAGRSAPHRYRYQYPRVYHRSINQSRTQPRLINRHYLYNSQSQPIIINDSWHRRVRFRGNSRVILLPRR